MDKVAYVENKIARVIGDFDRAKKLASEVVSSVGEELLSSFQFLAQSQNDSLNESFDSAESRNARACMLKAATAIKDLFQAGEVMQETDFVFYQGDNLRIPSKAGGVYVKTNLSEFIVLDSDYIVEIDEISNASGLAVELSLTILKALASKVGTHLGVKLLEQLGLAEKQISLEELRRQLVADIEQKNVEQTLREQRGKFTAISWDLTALYPRLKEQEKYSFLLKKEEAVSACLGVLSDSMHCVPGAPDYLTCSSLFLLIIQEIIKATDENPYENPLYKQALQRVLEPVGTLKTGLEKRRRDYVGPTRHIRYDCVQCRGEVMCSNAITWYDQKTGKETWCYPISKEKPKDWDARAANERNQYLISLDRESDWVWEISNMWQEEMNKCR